MVNIDILGLIIFVVGGCPLHCRIFSSILTSDLQMPVVPQTPEVLTSKNVSDIVKCPLGVQIQGDN